MSIKQRSESEQRRVDKNNLHAARKGLLIWQPEAIRVRLEAGKCPGCKRSGCLVSYQLPDDLEAPLRGGMELCASWCRSCQFTGSTTREVSI